MITEEIAKQLHDRATRGKPLSTEEQARLEEWYAWQDEAEQRTLGLPSGDESRVAKLQAQVETALEQLRTLATRIQEIASENETLKQEIVVLRCQVAQQTAVHSTI